MKQKNQMTLKYVKFILLYIHTFLFRFIHLQGLQNEVLYHEWLLIGQAQFVLTSDGHSEGLAADWLIFSGPVHTLSLSALWWSEMTGLSY